MCTANKISDSPDLPLEIQAVSQWSNCAFSRLEIKLPGKSSTMIGIYHNLGCIENLHIQQRKIIDTQAQKIANTEISPTLLEKNGKTVIKAEWLV